MVVTAASMAQEAPAQSRSSASASIMALTYCSTVFPFQALSSLWIQALVTQIIVSGAALPVCRVCGQKLLRTNASVHKFRFG